MNNDANHTHSVPELKNINRAFYIGIGLNAVFTVVEFVVGYLTDSLALISDASHNLSDVASLVISLIGMRLAKKAATSLYTYGYKKASILASLINSILLIVIVIKIFIEGVERFSSPPEVAGVAIIITALIGVFINTISAYLFYKGQKHDINIKGAFLHLLVDALVSVGVVISGVIIYFTNWNIVDTIISFVIGVAILLTTWKLLVESVKLTLDGVPGNVNVKEIERMLLDNRSVEDIHHLHIWGLSSSQNALTVHIVLKNTVNTRDFLETKSKIKHDLEHENIHHATIEIDSPDSEGACEDC